MANECPIHGIPWVLDPDGGEWCPQCDKASRDEGWIDTYNED
ncbi:hypothetical protein LCGC14_0853250 [marine sediment metagenome]|uniref:Uncharacterized protein n=1 Tax=marine sediment metagenome TaxID=412755 RepID=A0A0F9SGR0_9ZZZZ